MAERFRNKYRIESNRLPCWDYSSNGIYFITIVIQGRDCLLGEIINLNGKPKIQLSEFGKIVKSEWLKSFEIRKELFLDEYIIMPNHIHALLIVSNPEKEEGLYLLKDKQKPIHQGNKINIKREFIRQPKSISSFIAGFKSAVNSRIDDYIDDYQLDIPKYNRNNPFFQSNYHDRIVRNPYERLIIRKYIKANPKKWMEEFF